MVDTTNNRGFGLFSGWMTWDGKWCTIHNGSLVFLVWSVEKVKWMLWLCYCHADRSLRQSFYNELTLATQIGNRLWARTRDLNDIIVQGEKSSGRSVL